MMRYALLKQHEEIRDASSESAYLAAWIKAQMYHGG